MELLFLEPVFKERIWGGSRLRTDFGYDIPSEHTGECWAISAHKNGATNIKNGKFAGVSLRDLWAKHPELFGQDPISKQNQREFPLLVKILDAKTDLSVQVHPDDEYAKRVENDLGKAECWYILNANPGSRIVYGHTAANIEEFKNLALTNQWDKLLINVDVNVGDFFDVPTGTVHAVGAGTLILEVQQSSDTTYRIYDYDRRDDGGNLRELHLDKSFAVIKAPYTPNNIKPRDEKIGKFSIKTLLTKNKYFEVQKLSVIDNLHYVVEASYLLVSVINGSGVINGFEIKKGDSFIVPNQTRVLDIIGNLNLIMSNEV